MKLRSTPTLDAPVDIGPLQAIDSYLRRRLVGRYGQDAPALVEVAKPGELAPINATIGRTALWAELRWAARVEGVVHLEDLLMRRVRLGLLLPKGGLDHMASIRAVAQDELGWDDQRWMAEEMAYARKWHHQYGAPGIVKQGELQHLRKSEPAEIASPAEAASKRPAVRPA